MSSECCRMTSKHVRRPIIGRANCSFWKDGKRSGARAGDERLPRQLRGFDNEELGCAGVKREAEEGR
jgi:hypothetical protein